MIYLFTRGWGEKKESTDDSYKKKKIDSKLEERDDRSWRVYYRESRFACFAVVLYVFGTVFLALIGTHTCFQILMSITKGDKLNKNTK